MPLYSEDEEKEHGFSNASIQFSNLLDQYDGFILSLAEHNGSYAAAFKNIFDWSSRVNVKVFREKPLLLMAASPGPRGGASVLEQAKTRFPRMGAAQLFTFSLPNFYDNLKNNTLENTALNTELKTVVKDFEAVVTL
jgi:Predicted flavoprotein